MSAGGDAHLVDVRLVDIALAVHKRTAEHYDTLNRELALVAEANDPEAAPARLVALSEELSNQFSGFTMAAQERLAQAMLAGDEVISLKYSIPPAVSAGAARLDALLDEVEQFCIEGALLTLVASPEIVGYRKWLLGEFVRQIDDGAAPMPWAEYRDAVATLPVPDEVTEALESEPERVVGEGEVVVTVRGDLDLDGASELRAELLDRVDRGEVDIVVDLSACRFLDSVGLSLLLTTRARCISSGGRLRVVQVSEQPARALELAGVLDIFT